MQTVFATVSPCVNQWVWLQVIGDLFTAGMETIKTTLEWTVVYMLRNPRVAKAVQEELDQVVGRNRLATLRDREFLPYTEATILEVLRISSVVPLGSTHAVTRSVSSSLPGVVGLEGMSTERVLNNRDLSCVYRICK